MLSLGNLVCFECKFHLRSFSSYGYGCRLCPHCKEPMYWIGKRLRVPPNRDKKAWEWLEEVIRFKNRKNKSGRKKSKNYLFNECVPPRGGVYGGKKGRNPLFIRNNW